jgi:intracellular multiplication protein IcmK
LSNKYFGMVAIFAAALPMGLQAQQQRATTRIEAVAAPELVAPVPTQASKNSPQGVPHSGVWQPTGRNSAPMPLPFAPPDLKSEALDRIAPMTPEQVRELRRDLDARTKAMQQALEVQAKPVRRQVVIDLSPGATPEVIRATFAQGSIISFVDAAGRPWNVKTVENFNPSGFDAALFGTSSVSVGVAQPNARAGNIGVLLEGVSTPLMFTFVTGQPEVDYALEVQLPRYAPGLAAPVGAVNHAPTANAAELMNYLLNTPPSSARALKTDSTFVKAWQISPTKMIVRAEGMLVAPAFSRQQSSQTGVSVYEVPLSPHILLSLKTQNQLAKVSVSGLGPTVEQK